MHIIDNSLIKYVHTDCLWTITPQKYIIYKAGEIRIFSKHAFELKTQQLDSCIIDYQIYYIYISTLIAITANTISNFIKYNG